MSTSIETLAAEVLSLSSSDRSNLLDSLIASLDADPDVEDAWMKEAKRRDDEIESGAVVALQLDDVLSRLRAQLR